MELAQLKQEYHVLQEYVNSNNVFTFLASVIQIFNGIMHLISLGSSLRLPNK